MSEGTAAQPMDARELAAARDFAVAAARSAGEVTLRYFRGGVTVERKADHSPVTVADREAEQLLRDRIGSRYPDHAILGEEFGEQDSDSPFRWIIDPIDGTKSFISGIPLYTVLVALCYENEPLLGVIHSPATDETVAATAGGGCTYNGVESGLRHCTGLDGALILTTDIMELARRRPGFATALYRSDAAGRTWADGYGYLMLASGRADAMLDPIVHPWDVAAVKPVLLEAGAKCTDFSGTSDGLGQSVVAAGAELHEALMEMLRRNPD